jgi:leucyl aminopeptidase
MATLTGSVMVGLGNYAAGVFTNDNNKAQDVIKMGLKNGEKYWQMPVFQQHFKNIKGPYSDLQNCNLSSLSDASNAAAFLSNFLNKGSSLVHLDIAGVASLDDGDGMMPKGATGFGVHSVYEHVVSQNPTKKF